TPSCSSSAFIWRLIADCVTNNSSPALVKLKLRAAASKPLSRSSDGNPLCITFPHVIHAKTSFALLWYGSNNACVARIMKGNAMDLKVSQAGLLLEPHQIFGVSDAI